MALLMTSQASPARGTYGARRPSRQEGSGAIRVLTAAHFGWLCLATLLLAIYGSIIPLQFQPRSLDEAVAVFREMSFFEPTLLEARGDWVVSLALFMALSYLAMAALCVD